jgi:hypothetical protein
MSNELQRSEGGSLVTMTLDETITLGKILAQSGFFQDSREAAQCITKIIAGKELGLGPVAAMTGIYVVKGKISLSANLIAATIKRSGKYDYRIRRLDTTACAIEFFERGQSVGTSTFTIQDAQAAGLAHGDNWRKHPRNMLFARAMSNGARWYSPDVFSGPVYTAEEMGLDVEEADEVVTVEAAAAEKPPEPPAVETITPQQHEELTRLIAQRSVDLQKFLDYFKVADLAALPGDSFGRARKMLLKKPLAQEPQTAA